MPKSLSLPSRRLVLDRPHVMGILNVTPDSFSDGGRYCDPQQAVAHALQMVEDGASLIDIGGESTRPGAEPVPADEEIRRVVPVIRALRARSEVVISIDTMKAAVMRAACEAGAELINDVYALRDDAAVAVARDSGAAVCLMHMQGEPRTMQQAPQYADVVAQVMDFLAERLAVCRAAGMSDDRLMVDPGFGFGKTLAQNLALMASLARFQALAPVLVGVSRKSMFGQLLGRPVDERLAAGLAAAIHAVQSGAAIVRTHDVRATMDALAVIQAVSNPGDSTGLAE